MRFNVVCLRFLVRSLFLGCLLFVAYSFLRDVRCFFVVYNWTVVVFVVCWLSCAACSLLFGVFVVVCWLLFARRCVSLVTCCLLCVRCVLAAVCCDVVMCWLLLAVYCLLLIVSCVLFGACCLLVVV